MRTLTRGTPQVINLEFDLIELTLLNGYLLVE